ncbi:MAG: DUF11 domain-containing protein [Lachnospiraceae bacterium]|nr:DUF11 domain-containing protein [Lachnospiraceae bacterium]MBQ8262988.1 DUF11 domain-containing protein [Lachnospiraceae bacterium]
MATFYNQATLSYNDVVTDSNIVTGEILEVLSATKTAVSDTYDMGDTVTYVISIVNSGTSAFTNLTVTDNLGSYSFGTGSLLPLTYVPGSVKYYINGILQAAPTVAVDNELIFSGISVPAGGNTTIVYEATANQYAPLGTGATITNTATVDGTGVLSDIIITETVTNAQGVNLTITKSLNPQAVVENGELTYTFVIQNMGGEVADVTDNVAITDTFNPILNDITVTYNGAVWPDTNYTYSQLTGLFQTTPGQITVPAATFSQNPTTGQWTVTPGVTTIKVTGTI